MKIIIHILIIFIFNAVYCQKDLSFELINVYNEEGVEFLNLVENESEIYCFTNKGTYKVKDKSIVKINSREGYGYIDNNEFYYSTIINNKIKYSPKYNYLFNYNKNSQNKHSFILKGETLFIINNNKLYIYKKSIFLKTLKNKSIRSISKNHVATYDGIYTKDEKIVPNSPSYSDGFIREFNDELLVCYNGLFRKRDTIFNSYDFGNQTVFINNKNLGYIQDIYKNEKNDNYFLFTNLGLYYSNLENSLKTIDIVNTPNRFDKKSYPKFIKFYNIDSPRLLYSINNEIRIFHEKIGFIETYYSLPFTPTSISFKNDTFYLLDGKKLYILKNGKLSQSLDCENCHTVKAISDSTLAITSNYDLFKVNLKKNSKRSILKNEFNALAIETFNDTIYFGSENGLFSVPKNDFETISNDNQIVMLQKKKTDYTLYILILCLAFLGTTIFYKSYFQKDKVLIITKEEKLKIDIIKFIEQHIATVNVDIILEKHNISYRKLNKILDNSPGKIIESKRKVIALNLMKKNKSLEEIALSSGYSISYLKKILKTN